MDFIYKTKWFAESAPVNKKKATIALGAGDNGVVTVSYDEYGVGGNSYSIEVVAGEGNDVALASELSGTKITVTLGTGVAGALDDAKNTATLIATSITALDGFTATASGTGATAFAEAIAEDSFEGGQWATPCKERYSLVSDDTYNYLCTQEGNETDTVWKRFTLADY